MVKSEFVYIVVQNFYRDINEYTILFQRGDIDIEMYKKLIECARDYWLAEV